jgi:release factor glutamine methyltransferase
VDNADGGRRPWYSWGLSFTVTDAVVRLRAAGCVFAEDEAAVLSTAATDENVLREMVRRRAGGEPLEQVVGYADFCGVRVRLRPGVFVPRVRSELLVRLATQEVVAKGRQAAHQAGTGNPATQRAGAGRKHATQRAGAGRKQATPPAGAGAVIVDLCCGSGALGLAVRHHAPRVVVHAADVDSVAVACARDNLGDHVHQGDLFAALPDDLRGRIDVLMANVPYVATEHIAFLPAEARDHEPHTALDGGPDGLDVFRAVAAEAPHWLARRGVLLSEITDAQRGPALAAVRAAGLEGDTVDDDDLEATVIRARRR